MSSDSLVLLDEPFSDVDAYSKERILPELKVWLKDREMSVLLATHDRREACEMAEQWTLLKDGHCIQQGEPQDLYHDPQDLWCAQFTGPFNVLSEQDMALLKLPLSGLNRWEMASETVMGCRPEQLLIRDIHDRGSASSIGGQGLLVSKRFVGRDWDCRVELDSGTPLQVLLHREPLIRCGQRVELYFREVRGGV
jgi:ABC-type Fe3+/spermidine/putrescine transport system ATPase subunit